MTGAFNLIFDFINDLISLLDMASFDLYGFRVSYWSLIVVFIVISFFANVWWKGAKG